MHMIWIRITLGGAEIPLECMNIKKGILNGLIPEIESRDQ